jgi:hypothetical protein
MSREDLGELGVNSGAIERFGEMSWQGGNK